MGKWKHRLSDIDEASRTAICSNCGPVKIGKATGRFWRCRKAINETQRVGKYRRKWGAIPPNADTRCEICAGTIKIAYDHSHATGEFSGWLCMKCNTALGLVDDDVKILAKMIAYLS